MLFLASSLMHLAKGLCQLYEWVEKFENACDAHPSDNELQNQGGQKSHQLVQEKSCKVWSKNWWCLQKPEMTKWQKRQIFHEAKTGKMTQVCQKWSILAEIWFCEVMLVMTSWVEPVGVGTEGQNSDRAKKRDSGEMVLAAKWVPQKKMREKIELQCIFWVRRFHPSANREKWCGALATGGQMMASFWPLSGLWPHGHEIAKFGSWHSADCSWGKSQTKCGQKFNQMVQENSLQSLIQKLVERWEARNPEMWKLGIFQKAGKRKIMQVHQIWSILAEIWFSGITLVMPSWVEVVEADVEGHSNGCSNLGWGGGKSGPRGK